MALRYSKIFGVFFLTKHICESKECVSRTEQCPELETVNGFRIEVCSFCKQPMKEVVADSTKQFIFN